MGRECETLPPKVTFVGLFHGGFARASRHFIVCNPFNAAECLVLNRGCHWCLKLEGKPADKITVENRMPKIWHEKDTPAVCRN